MLDTAMGIEASADALAQLGSRMSTVASVPERRRRRRPRRRRARRRRGARAADGLSSQTRGRCSRRSAGSARHRLRRRAGGSVPPETAAAFSPLVAELGAVLDAAVCGETVPPINSDALTLAVAKPLLGELDGVLAALPANGAGVAPQGVPLALVGTGAEAARTATEPSTWCATGSTLPTSASALRRRRMRRRRAACAAVRASVSRSTRARGRRCRGASASSPPSRRVSRGCVRCRRWRRPAASTRARATRRPLHRPGRRARDGTPLPPEVAAARAGAAAVDGGGASARSTSGSRRSWTGSTSARWKTAAPPSSPARATARSPTGRTCSRACGGRRVAARRLDPRRLLADPRRRQDVAAPATCDCALAGGTLSVGVGVGGGCDAVPLSGKTVDECGVCGGLSCAGCDGVPWSGLVDDACFVCAGDNSTCAGWRRSVVGPAV